MKKNELSKRIVTSIIEADVTENDVRKFVEKYKKYSLYAIAIDLPYLKLVKELLEGTGIRLSAVASYPLGGMTTESKINQLEYAIQIGADEIDVSMNYNAINSGDFDRVSEEVKKIAKAAADKIEVIMVPQTSILTFEETKKVINSMLESGIKAIKTNSGFGWNTIPEDIIFLKRIFEDKLKRIDVSGGVRTAQQAEEYLKLGADYIHTSTPDKVLEEV